MSKVKILIVEDEGIIAKDLQLRLKNLEYAIPYIAFSGKEAIKKAAEIKPDLILMDIILDDYMDGIEAADEIRRHFDIPVVFVTAYADEEILQKVKGAEQYGYLFKPFEEKTLYCTIEMALWKYKVEKKLKGNIRDFGILLEDMNNAAIVIDRNGIVIFMNELAGSFSGWEASAVKGEKVERVLNIVTERENASLGNILRQILSTGNTLALTNHFTLISKTGTEKSIGACFIPIRTAGQNIDYVVILLHEAHHD
ncbi:MAG: response regulator [Candidatus Omnitrophica bacterium]|nr:response regulator [Candidatus Omnitrophota bacterium]